MSENAQQAFQAAQKELFQQVYDIIFTLMEQASTEDLRYWFTLSAIAMHGANTHNQERVLEVQRRQTTFHAKWLEARTLGIELHFSDEDKSWIDTLMYMTADESLAIIEENIRALS